MEVFSSAFSVNITAQHFSTFC